MGEKREEMEGKLGEMGRKGGKWRNGGKMGRNGEGKWGE